MLWFRNSWLTSVYTQTLKVLTWLPSAVQCCCSSQQIVTGYYMQLPEFLAKPPTAYNWYNNNSSGLWWFAPFKLKCISLTLIAQIFTYIDTAVWIYAIKFVSCFAISKTLSLLQPKTSQCNNSSNLTPNTHSWRWWEGNGIGKIGKPLDPWTSPCDDKHNVYPYRIKFCS